MKRLFVCISILIFGGLFISQFGTRVSSQSGRVNSNANKPAIVSPSNTSSLWKYYLGITRSNAARLSDAKWLQISASLKKAGIPTFFGRNETIDYNVPWRPARLLTTPQKEGWLILGPLTSEGSAIAALYKLPGLLPKNGADEFRGVEPGRTIQAHEEWMVGEYEVQGFKTNLPARFEKVTVPPSTPGVIEGQVIRRDEYMIGFGITVESGGIIYDVPIETRSSSLKNRSGKIDTVGNWVRIKYSRKTPTATGDFDLVPTQVIQIPKPSIINRAETNDVLPILKKRAPESNATSNWENGLGMEFALIRSGQFKMGSNLEDEEKPVHNVTITNDFYIGKHEVTQKQWRSVMNLFPSRCDYPYELFRGDNLPMICVTYAEVEDFIKQMNKRGEGVYRLPTEAEWEYAARGGSTVDVLNNLDSVAWFDENSDNRIHDVGEKQPNGFGLYDIYGNVWEWCQDYYDNYYYRRSPKTDPMKATGYGHVARGGSWQNPSKFARPAAPGFGAQSDSRLNWVGFRLVRQP
jgi:formylglycine-generating enzyme required for sulfatase activity